MRKAFFSFGAALLLFGTALMFSETVKYTIVFGVLFALSLIAFAVTARRI